ncbi:MAG TPA: ABC transporter substrate-binding protein [Xanthobacteraceae bacterium]|jgi:ABC-type nitrate/sulfonate/bicarbonate transport system substrate-binding protein
MPARHACSRTLILALLVLTAPNAGAAELLRVGKSVPEAFSFVPLDVGMRVGLFRKYGVEIEPSSLAGGARLQQALAGDSIDIGLGSGPEMASIQKGSPVRAVAAMAGAPRLLALLVRPDGAIKSVADLKGKKIGVTTTNSLTAWLVSELARQQGWGPNGIDVTPLGATPGQFAALKTRQIDGLVSDIATLLQAQANGYGKILFRFGDLVQDFHIHVIFATDKLIAQRPDAIRSFLEAWFETIAFMRAERARTIDIAKDIISVDPAITAQTYDELMPMFSADGKFNPKALAVLSRSYVDLKILPSEPDMSKFYTEEFLPN